MNKLKYIFLLILLGFCINAFALVTTCTIGTNKPRVFYCCTGHTLSDMRNQEYTDYWIEGSSCSSTNSVPLAKSPFDTYYSNACNLNTRLYLDKTTSFNSNGNQLSFKTWCEGSGGKIGKFDDSQGTPPASSTPPISHSECIENGNCPL